MIKYIFIIIFLSFVSLKEKEKRANEEDTTERRSKLKQDKGIIQSHMVIICI